jgi:DNA-directed RNA polymerase subunit beta'
MPTSDDRPHVVISIMSPETVLKLSRGEVEKPFTLSMKDNLKPEKGGLLCQRIFGPVERGVCACGKYHRLHQKKTVVCRVCGVTLQRLRPRGGKLLVPAR